MPIGSRWERARLHDDGEVGVADEDGDGRRFWEWDEENWARAKKSVMGNNSIGNE